jgi:hypothetical protein
LQKEVKGILNVANETLSEKEQGMPSDVGTSKNGAVLFLKERVWNKVCGWMEKILLAGGKGVLIKSVDQAIPVYSMG